MKAYKWLLNEIGQDAITDNPLNIAKLLEKYHNEIEAKPQPKKVLIAGDQGDYIKKLNAAIQAQPSTLTDGEIRDWASDLVNEEEFEDGFTYDDFMRVLPNWIKRYIRDKAQWVDIEHLGDKETLKKVSSVNFYAIGAIRYLNEDQLNVLISMLIERTPSYRYKAQGVDLEALIKWAYDKGWYDEQISHNKYPTYQDYLEQRNQQPKR